MEKMTFVEYLQAFAGKVDTPHHEAESSGLSDPAAVPGKTVCPLCNATVEASLLDSECPHSDWISLGPIDLDSGRHFAE